MKDYAQQGIRHRIRGAAERAYTYRELSVVPVDGGSTFTKFIGQYLGPAFTSARPLDQDHARHDVQHQRSQHRQRSHGRRDRQRVSIKVLGYQWTMKTSVTSRELVLSLCRSGRPSISVGTTPGSAAYSKTTAPNDQAYARSRAGGSSVTGSKPVSPPTARGTLVLDTVGASIDSVGVGAERM